MWAQSLEVLNPYDAILVTLMDESYPRTFRQRFKKLLQRK